MPGGSTTMATSWDNLVDAFNVWVVDQAPSILLGVALAGVIIMAIVVISMEEGDDGRR